MQFIKRLVRCVSFLMVCGLFATGVVFSSGAVDINVGVYDGTAVLTGSGPVATNNVFLWKIAVYKAKNPSADKTSDLSNFQFMGTKFLCRPKNTYPKGNTFLYASNPFNYIGKIRIGLADKLIYADAYTNGRDLNAVHSTRMLQSDDLLVWNMSLPLFSMDQNSSAYKGVVESFFRDNAYSIAKSIAGDGIGDENDTWLIVFEPTTHAYLDSSGRVAFTPTQYAVAQNYPSKQGGFNSYLPPKKGALGYAGLVGIHNASCAAYIVDGSYLSLDKNAHWGYHTAWTKTKQSKTFLYAMDNWGEVRDAVIRFGGAGIVFSQGFELPDYTVEASAPSVAWENETIEIGSTVHNSNPARGGSVNVTMTYLDANGQALQSQTKNVTMAGKTTEYVSWQINAGTYSQTGADNARSVRITVTPVGDPNKRLEINGDNNSAGGQLKLMRNFSVSDVCINDSTSPVRIEENTTVTATFTVTNHNPFRAYENIYIGVYLKKSNGAAVSLGGQSVTLAAGAKKHGKMRINVGSVTANCDQVFTVIATVNLQGVSASRGRVWVYEFEQRGGTTHTLEDNRNRRSNKGFTEGNIIVTRKMSMGMQIFAGTYSNRNASVTTDKRTTGMVTCVLENSGNYNMYETNASKDRLYAQISYNGKTQKSPVVCVPAKGTNITWFKVEIPNASNIVFSGKLIWKYQTVYVDAEGETHTREKEEIFDAPSVKSTINTITVHKTPDTVLDKDAAERTNTSASGYSKASGYVVNHTERPRVAQWEQWKMSGSTFVLHRYALAGEVTKAQLPPANMGNEKEYVNVKGQIASGSAFSLDFSYGVKKQSSMGDPIKDSDYTLVQNAIALFPEFGYKRGETASRTLFFSGNNLGAPMYFDLNRSADGEQNGAHTGQRVHFTPLNMPDGTYKVAVEGYDLWTPAGMIYVIATPSLTVHGSIYDYNYMS